LCSRWGRRNKAETPEGAVQSTLLSAKIRTTMRIHKLCHGVLLLPALTLAQGLSCAQDAKPEKYPLRLHVLAIDNTRPTMRLQPNWCSGTVPNFGADVSASGTSGDTGGSPCSSGGAATFGGDDDFSGGGRGDLVTPSSGSSASASSTQALSFTYDGCSRVRVPPGFQGLPARWKRPGKLEVLIPSDKMTVDDRPAPTQRCTLTATLQEFVYLRMRNGALLKVSQEAYVRRPALRKFLSGGAETLQPRVPPTVPVKQLMKSPQ
jgi:hypothetical protein